MARKTTPTSGRKPTGTARGAKSAATRARKPGAVARKTAPARKAATPKTAASRNAASKAGTARTTAPRTGIPTRTKPAAARAGRSAAAVRQPVQSKQELRDRIEKLERANVVLRAKNREAVEASREAANRIDQLQEQLSRHETVRPAPSDTEMSEVDASGEAAAKPARRGRKPRQKAEPVAEEPAAGNMTDEADDET